MQIGFIGLGAMGLPMTRHLLAAGHDVTVASRSRPPIDAAVAAGAREGANPRAVAAASEITILCVPDSPDVVEVIDAVLPALGPAGCLVSASAALETRTEDNTTSRVVERMGSLMDERASDPA